VKTLKTEVAFSTPWFDILAKTVDTEDAPYYSLRVPDYACVLAITEEQRILAVRQYRPAVDRYTVELPSGIVDDGEAPAEAAGRELLEETGYAAASIEVLGSMLPDTGRLSNRMWNCVATGVRRIDNRSPEPGIEVVTYTTADLARAITGGEFDHSLHVALLLQAMLRGVLRLP
jgi:8-oxo-dGTP pyrophosphatase MutT (NUDIX family)